MINDELREDWECGVAAIMKTLGKRSPDMVYVAPHGWKRAIFDREHLDVCAPCRAKWENR